MSNTATFTRSDVARRSSGKANVVGRHGILSQLIQRLHLKRIKLKSQESGGLYTSSGHGKTHALLRGPQTLLAFSSSFDCYADTALTQCGGISVLNLGGVLGVRMKAETEL
jgi:hypothetical protein